MKVWDGFIRGFHGLLILLIGGLWFTGGKLEHVDLHQTLGVFMLALLLTRVIWGVWGSENARFSYFLKSPRHIIAYIRDFRKKDSSKPELSHNPLGGWSVIAMLVLILCQGLTGLFTDDGIFFRGPLAQLVSSDLAYTLTSIHHLLWSVLKVLIIIHVAVIITYRVYGRALTMAMVHGKKRFNEQELLHSEAPKLVPGYWGYLILLINTLWLYYFLG